MTSNVRLSTTARAKLESFPLSLMDEIMARLCQLAENPASLSQPSALPLLPGFLIHSFRITDFEETVWHFTVRFHRKADEEGIFIYNITVLTQTKEELDGPTAP